MLIPRFSIRSLLLLTTGCGFVFLILNFGVRGHFWARAVWIGLASLLLSFVLFAAFFAGAFVLASLFGMVRREPKAASPFATDRPPPQVIPPVEVD